MSLRFIDIHPHIISEDTVKWMTRIHHWNRYVLLVLIVLHLAAVLLHWVWKRENLVAPMLHGRRPVERVMSMRTAPLWLAIALLVASALAVGCLVAWGEAA